MKGDLSKVNVQNPNPDKKPQGDDENNDPDAIPVPPDKQPTAPIEEPTSEPPVREPGDDKTIRIV